MGSSILNREEHERQPPDTSRKGGPTSAGKAPLPQSPCNPIALSRLQDHFALMACKPVSYKQRGSEPSQAALTNGTIFVLVKGLAPCSLMAELT